MKKKEINPYIEKADLYPDQLINDVGEGLNQVQKDVILSKLANFKEIFLEIGSGSGQFLIQHAKLNQKALFTGIEIRYKRSVRTIEKANRDGLNNICIIRTDANQINDFIPANALSAIYINFPDPWDKKRWLKHRIINDKNLDIFQGLLKQNACLSFKTDHRDYFLWTKKYLDSHSGFQLTEISEDLHSSEFAEGNILTEFEQLFQFKKKSIYYLSAFRV